MRFPKFLPKYCPIILLPVWWCVWVLFVVLEFLFHSCYFVDSHFFRFLKIKKRKEYEDD